jgi:biotin transporter BioY
MSLDPLSSVQLTPGVTSEDQRYSMCGLDLSINASHPNLIHTLLEFGFASQKKMTLAASRSRAKILKISVVEAVIQSFVHNLLGMKRWAVATVVLFVLATVLGLPSFTAIGIALLLFFASILVHEAGHVAAFRLVSTAGHVGVLVSRGARCYLVRGVLSRRHEALITISGPIAPFLASTFLLPLTVTANSFLNSSAVTEKVLPEDGITG